MALPYKKRTIVTALLLLSALMLSSSTLNGAKAATPGFDLSIQPTIQYIAPGMSTAYTILVVSRDGFSSPIELAVKDVPSGVTVSLSSSTVTPPANGVAYSILTVSLSRTSQTGTFRMSVTGSSGALTKSTSVRLTITTASQFALSVTPSSQTASPGMFAEYEVTVSSIGEFSSDVSLNLDGFPGITFSFNPSSVRPAQGGVAKSTLTIKVDKSADTGTYTFVVEASTKRPDLTQYSSAVLVITKLSDFVLTASPSSRMVTVGETTTFSLVVTSIGGFSSDVALTLPAAPQGVGFAIDPFILRPTPASPASSNLKISTTIDARPGTYVLVIVGSSDGKVRSLVLALTIYPITSYLTILLSSTAVKQGETMTLKVTLSPKIAGAAVILTYTKPDQTTVVRTARTGEDGTFSDSYAPEEPGTWQVLANWQGDQTHAGATSKTATFQVSEVSFIERNALMLGVLALVLLLAVFGWVMYRKGKLTPAAVEEKGPPAPPVAPTPAPRLESREAPPLILSRKYCFNCGDVISAESLFCDKCRAPQPDEIEKKHEAPPLVLPRKYCFNCGEVISAQAAFCDKCRAPQP